MTVKPRAVIAVPLYNHAHKLQETLQSLIGQTRSDFAVILSDDCSSDATPDISRHYAGRHENVHYIRSDQRLGYIGNARRCFELARQYYPDAEFFAWGSDHDLWHPRWLDAMIGALDANPKAVAAIPLTQPIDADGKFINKSPERFSHRDDLTAARRFRHTADKIPAGDAIYGLFRLQPLEQAGIMPWHIAPDRLLLSKLSLWGTVVQVPEVLWYRRYRGLYSVERQIRASFLVMRPWYLRLPWYLAHSGILLKEFTLNPGPNSPVKRSTGAGLALTYACLGLKRQTRKLLRKSAYKYIKAPYVAALGAESDTVRALASNLQRIGRKVRQLAHTSSK